MLHQFGVSIDSPRRIFIYILHGISEEPLNKTIGLLLLQQLLRLRRGYRRKNMAPNGCLRSTVEPESAGILQDRLVD